MTDEIRPIVTVDIALFTLREGALSVALLPRDREPYAERPALVGGWIHVDEDADATATAVRVLKQKAGLTVPYLEQLYSFSGPVRDPRGWSVSIAFIALVPAETLLESSGADLMLTPVDALPPLPFDHAEIVETAVRRLRGKASYSSLPAFLLPEHFTLAELHSVYQQVIGTRLDRASFRRKILDQGVIEAVAGRQRTGHFRPAQLYRLSDASLIEFERTI